MASDFHIEGLGGKRTLSGEIAVRGAKNAALPAFASSLLFSESIELENVPDIEDIKRMAELLSSIGARVEHIAPEKYRISSPTKVVPDMPVEVTKKFRASVVLTGPILAREGRVSFPAPGGDLIGARPIDLFLEGFVHMGARLSIHAGIYTLEAPKRGLTGCEIILRQQSVTATTALVMAGLLAKGTTVIKNAAFEPEIVSLVKFLKRSGGKIDGEGTPTLTIEGGGLLKPAPEPYRVPPDRIEAGSFLILGVLAGSHVVITNCNSSELDVPIEMIRYASDAEIIVGKNRIEVKNKRSPSIRATNVRTHEYPGFPTDLQAPMTVFLTQAEGESLIFETIFESRLGYIPELVRMGADITVCDPHRAIVRGPRELRGAELTSPDVRAGLAYILAAIVAKGPSVIHNVYTIDRGYERIEKRFASLGLDIERVEARD